MTGRFWPITETCQADYERLREAALAGIPLVGEQATRFERLGLTGLIAAPASGLSFEASLVGARRPAWTPYADPRAAILAAAFDLVLASPGTMVLDFPGVR